MEKRNLKYFCFTGGCFSGKTTTMNLIKERFENIHNINCMILSEPIRDYKGTVDISEFRKDVRQYLQMQIDTCEMRTKRELEVLEKYKNEKICILQGGVADCIFYSRHYINRNTLPDDLIDSYDDLLFYLDNFGEDNSYNYVYDYVLEFKPLEIKAETDDQKSFRPKDIDEIKYTEYKEIHNWNEWFCSPDAEHKNSLKYKIIDLNQMSKDDLNQYIDKLAEEIKDEWKDEQL